MIVSDALDMAGACAGRGIPEAAVLSLAAGADLLCIGPDKDVALVREIQAAIVAAVGAGRLAESRLAEAADRIARMPRGGGVSVAGDEARQVEGARSAVVVEGELPDLTGAEVVSVATAANIAIGEVPWGLVPDRVDRARRAGRPATGRSSCRCATRTGAPKSWSTGAAVVVEWGWPGPYDGAVPRICTRGYSRPAAVVVDELLRKAGWDR